MTKIFTIELEHEGRTVRFRTRATSEADAQRRARQFFARESAQSVAVPGGAKVATRSDAPTKVQLQADLKAARQINADLERLGADIQREHSAFREQRAALLADQ
jgi:hypothetical protein